MSDLYVRIRHMTSDICPFNAVYNSYFCVLKINLTMQEILRQLGINESNEGTSTGSSWIPSKGNRVTSFSPVDGKSIASVVLTDNEAYEEVLKRGGAAFLEWRPWPFPKRGEVVRLA